MKRYICSLVAAAALTLPAFGQIEDAKMPWSDLHGLEYEVFAGVNIGGASPVPVPNEIRKIESYDPELNLNIGVRATKMFDDRWGARVTLKFETKGMNTRARVKNYGMEIMQDGSILQGNWTGNVQTKFSASYVTLPITAVYRINSRWSVNAGPYVSYCLNREFSGYVYEGYLREGDPTGNKVVFEGDARASYDFSHDMRRFQWGAQLGGSWAAFRHFSVIADLTWGFNGIFKSSFKTVKFDMYPIYLNLGFAYKF